MRKYKLADRWAQNNQGQWLDASGDPITDERVLRHAETIKIMIVATWPKGYCKNSREEFMALFNNGVEEVYRSLTKYNKHDALSKVSSTSKRKRMTDEERLAWKRDNEAEALADGERIWVKNALRQFFWRIRYDNSDMQLGGTEIPVDWNEMQNECFRRELDEDGEAISSFEPSKGADVIPMRDLGYENRMLMIDVKQAVTDLQMLLEIKETEGDAPMMEHYGLLSVQRQENLREFYLNSDFSGAVDPFSNSATSANVDYLRNLHELNEASKSEIEDEQLEEAGDGHGLSLVSDDGEDE